MTAITFVVSVAETSALLPASTVTLSPVVACVSTLRMKIETAPETPTKPPAPAAVTEVTVSLLLAETATSCAARRTAPAPTVASACRWMIPTVTPAPTPTSPTAIDAAISSMWNWLPAATRTDWFGSSTPVSGSLTCAPVPTVAVVWTLTMSTVPETATPTSPPEAATPTAAMSSLFVAVTATPLKLLSLPGVTVRGPLSDGSAEGSPPDLTRLWPRPVACEPSRWICVPFIASSFDAASSNGPEVLPMT